MINRMQDFSENFSALIIEDNLGDFILIEDYLQEKFEKITLVHCQDYTTSVDYMKNSKEKFSVILNIITNFFR
jgi:hypothetical protein